MQVTNGKTTGFVGTDKIYIGRKNSHQNLPQSPLANPYVISDKILNRNAVIELYRQWLWQQIKSWRETGIYNPAVQELLNLCELVRQGKEINLVCWCKPKPCHGDVIVRCVQWMIREGL